MWHFRISYTVDTQYEFDIPGCYYSTEYETFEECLGAYYKKRSDYKIKNKTTVAEFDPKQYPDAVERMVAYYRHKAEISNAKFYNVWDSDLFFKKKGEPLRYIAMGNDGALSSDYNDSDWKEVFGITLQEAQEISRRTSALM